MIYWSQVDPARHWSHTAKRLRLFKTTAVAWIPLPIWVFMGLFPRAPWKLALPAGIAWIIFWIWMDKKGLVLSTLSDLVRQKFQSRELYAMRNDADEF